MSTASRCTRVVAALALALTAWSIGISGGNVHAAAATSACGGRTINGIHVPSPQQSSSVAEICRNGSLQAAIAVSFPWLLQNPKTGAYYGAADFLAHQIAGLLNVKVDYVPTDWSVVVAGLVADKYQVIMSPLLDTPARRKVISFVNYSTDGNCYALLKSNHSIRTLSDLNNPKVRILTFTGTGNEEAVKRLYPKATDVSIVEPPGGEIGALQQVVTRRVDVVAIDSSSANVVVAKYPNFRIIPRSAGYCVVHPDSPFYVGMGYRKGDRAMGAFLQEVVTKYQRTINQLVEKYSSLKYWNG
jgi:polar amino acid transport system substrate-binding protein